jgi:hypothetical protein
VTLTYVNDFVPGMMTARNLDRRLSHAKMARNQFNQRPVGRAIAGRLAHSGAKFVRRQLSERW